MGFIDIHTHLGAKNFDADRDETVSRAKEAGVKIIIENSISAASIKETLDLAKRYDIVKAALGIHPTEVIKMDDEALKKGIGSIREQKDNKDFVAVGEVGLDYHWFKEDKDHDKQKRAFQKLIDLAKELDRPIIVHSRKAETDIIEMLEGSEMKKVILHAFGGNMKLVEKCAKNRWFFSIPANVVNSEHFQEIVRRVNINQLFTETDAPYLGLKRGERNEPASVIDAAKMISEIKGFELKEVENSILMNYQRLFG